MSPHLLKAAQMMEAAVPASGFRPATPDEWARALRARVEIGYAMLRDRGRSDSEARELAEQLFGGAIGMLNLMTIFSEMRDE